jgi:hypothetical protein
MAVTTAFGLLSTMQQTTTSGQCHRPSHSMHRLCTGQQPRDHGHLRLLQLRVPHCLFWHASSARCWSLVLHRLRVVAAAGSGVAAHHRVNTRSVRWGCSRSASLHICLHLATISSTGPLQQDTYGCSRQVSTQGPMAPLPGFVRFISKARLNAPLQRVPHCALEEQAAL